MSLGKLADQWVLSLDRFLGKAQIRLCERKGCLLSIFFHSLFADEAEVRALTSDPQQAITVGQFREVIQYFQEAGYDCVSPADVLRGLNPKKRHFLLTFDDGYFNNHRALPVLEELKATATFFISAGHVRLGKAFWWDILYRAGKAASQSTEQIYHSFGPLKKMTTEQVEASIEKELGPAVFRPAGDTDRPFTAAELRDFSRSEHVFIGNHTDNHAILGNYPEEGVRKEIATAQQWLEEITDKPPLAIAYPNGDFTPAIARVAASCGLKLGFATQARKDYVPRIYRGEKIMQLGRMCPNGQNGVRRQCEYFRSDLALYERYQQFKKPLKAMLRRGR
jgi:peptidoglycan/xylan/chitin deacetylase (PgdA/CDA1 family)